MAECPERAEIEGLVSGRLPPDRLEDLERHVNGCRECRRVLDDLFVAGTILPSGPAPESRRHPPSDALKRVMEELRATPLPSEASSPTEPSEVRTRALLPFLQPTDRPGFLGRLGIYDVRREIGRGGMGVVFEALDSALKRTVAVKVLSPLAATDDEARGRFLREAQAAAALEHEHVVTIHAVDQVHDMPFLVMQYVAGESLADRLGREKRLAFADALQIGAQVARGLEAAHAKGLVHRDIKPANILLEEVTGRAKIADFGLSKAAGEGSLTLAGTVVGTPEFMSPEQAAGGPVSQSVDARSDLFSLGVVLYVACSGISPFKGESPLLTLDRVRRDEVPALNRIDPELPEWFSAVVQRLLMKSPADRFATAAEVASILEGTKTVSPTIALYEASPPTVACAPSTRRSWRLGWVAAIVGLLGVATATVIYTNRDRPEKDHAGPLPASQSDVEEKPGEKPVGPKPAPRVGFVIAGKEQSYRTLAEATAAARDGEVIEVHGNGPFPTAPVRLGVKPLTIRAAAGARPVLVSALPNQPESGPILRSEADLQIEGIEIRWKIDAPKGTAEDVMLAHCAVVHTRGRLTLSHCRFAPGQGTGSVGASGRELAVSNCIFAGPEGFGVFFRPEPAGRIAIEGCQFENLIAVMVYTPADVPVATPTPAAATVLLAENTFVSGDALRLLLNYLRKQPLKVTACRNIFDTEHLVMLMGPLGKKGDKSLETTRSEDMRNYLSSFVEWSDDANIYRRDCKYLVTTLNLISQIHSARIDGPLDWARVWKQSATQSIEGVFQFHERPKSQTGSPLRLVRVVEATGGIPDRVGADPDRIGPR